MRAIKAFPVSSRPTMPFDRATFDETLTNARGRVLGARNATKDDFRAVFALLRGQSFPVSDVVTCVVPMDEAPDALRGWDENPHLVTRIHVDIE